MKHWTHGLIVYYSQELIETVPANTTSATSRIHTVRIHTALSLLGLKQNTGLIIIQKVFMRFCFVIIVHEKLSTVL